MDPNCLPVFSFWIPLATQVFESSVPFGDLGFVCHLPSLSMDAAYVPFVGMFSRKASAQELRWKLHPCGSTGNFSFSQAAVPPGRALFWTTQKSHLPHVLADPCSSCVHTLPDWKYMEIRNPYLPPTLYQLHLHATCPKDRG